MFGIMKHQGTTPAALPDSFRRQHYCGVCKAMGTTYGQSARVFLNHDTVFLSELLSAISDDSGGCKEWEKSLQSINCFKIPRDAKTIPVPLRFAADVNVLLACIKIKDNRKDHSKIWGLADRWYAGFGEDAKENLEAWGLSIKEIHALLQIQEEIEGFPELIKGPQEGRFWEMSRPTAEITGKIFEAGANAVHQSTKTLQMKRLGEAFGRLVFWVDAWEDFDKDAKSGNFNAIREAFGNDTKEAALSSLHGEANQFERELKRLGMESTVVDFFVRRLENRVPEWKSQANSVTGACSTQPKKKINLKKRGGLLKSLNQFWNKPGFGEKSPIWKNALGFGAAAGIVMVAPSLLEDLGKLFVDYDPDWSNAVNQAGSDHGLFQLRGDCCCDDGCCRNCKCGDDCDDTCSAFVIMVMVLLGLLIIGVVIGLIFLIRALTRTKKPVPVPQRQGGASAGTFGFREIKEYPQHGIGAITDKLNAWLLTQSVNSGPEITQNEPDRKVISASYLVPFHASQNGQSVDLGSVMFELHIHVIDNRAAFVFQEFYHQAGANVPAGGALSSPFPQAQNSIMTTQTWEKIKAMTAEKVTSILGEVPWF